ncbi:DUF3826 domain-containing protein [Roseimarinus sediminis]|uniref:DUF3826 domain-containing protein n=1 Tax=Roseimarinus sediminis TaxID=1610899 RepID=UPI003D1BF4D0
MKKIQTIFLVMLLMSGNLFATTVGNSQEKLAQYVEEAGEWVAALNLNDVAKEQRLTDAIAIHRSAVKNWHDTHPASTVPEGINPRTGDKLTELDRQMIADSAIPASVHENLMKALRADLTEEQVELILDKYTIGKVDFTMRGYKAIVPDLTAEEEAKILGYMKEAREMAIDYKSMKQISAIFEIYKTKSEQYLISNGRDWRQLYKDFVKSLKEQKK